MKKLNLDELKVESFVTTMENNEVNTVKGGADGGWNGATSPRVGCNNDTVFCLDTVADVGCEPNSYVCPTQSPMPGC